MDEEKPEGLPHCLQRGPDGKLNGRPPEEMRVMCVKALEIRVKRKEWKAQIRKAIREAKVRPSDVIREIFETEEGSPLRNLTNPIKLRTFLQNIPGIGAKKAETLLVIAQISTAKGKYDRRISFLAKESIRKRFLEALDAWYDQYRMEKQYKRKRATPKRDIPAKLRDYQAEQRLKKLKEPKIVDDTADT